MRRFSVIIFSLNNSLKFHVFVKYLQVYLIVLKGINTKNRIWNQRTFSLCRKCLVKVTIMMYAFDLLQY